MPTKTTALPGLRGWLFGSAALALVLLAGCAIRPTPTPRGLKSRSAVTLTLWHASDGAARTLLSDLANDFHTAYPWITVRVEAEKREGDLLRQTLAAVALNQAPDVVIAEPRTLTELARRGALIDLSSYVDDPASGFKPEEQNDFIPGALEAGRFYEFHDQLLALPFDQHEVVLYANMDLLKAGNVTGLPRTWEAFGEAALSATNDGTPGWDMTPDATIFYALIFSHGGQVLDDTQSQILFNQPAGVDTLTLTAMLSNSGAVYLAADADDARRYFTQGRAAFWFGTTRDLPTLPDAIARSGRFHWSVTSLPQSDPRHPATAFAGRMIALLKGSSERAQAAWAFAHWLVAPEQTARWSKATLALPVRLSAQALLTNDPSAEVEALLRSDTGQTPVTRLGPTFKGAADFDAAIVEMWTAVANGTEPAPALARAVDRVSRILGSTP
ncbi:MAG: extracellular solute-binding protein [Chloroflexi bacterium]|nr:extracellular solute-binding protein [Chloroflexota bacterium]